MGQTLFVTDASDDGPVLAPGQMGAKPQGLHSLAYVVELVVRHVMARDDDHEFSLVSCALPDKKSPRLSSREPRDGARSAFSERASAAGSRGGPIEKIVGLVCALTNHGA